jgi:phosphoglycolate phosphatase-like HAD superfamily hydrolase
MESKIEFIPDFPMDDGQVADIEGLVEKAMNNPSNFEWEKDKKNMRAVIFDVDGTLCDVRGGIRLTPKGEFDWKEFERNMPYYPPNEWCVRMAQIYYQMGFVVYVVTARQGKHEEKTKKWLAKYHVPYDFLCMRKTGDVRPDNIVKKEILDTQLPKKELIEFVVDDRESVVQMWRDEGLTVLQCNSHDFL